MIYIDVFYKALEEGEEWKADRPNQVIITYPNEEDFMKDRVVVDIIPHNGHLRYEEGLYVEKKGWFPEVLEVEGIRLDNKKHVIISLPRPSCIITKHL